METLPLSRKMNAPAPTKPILSARKRILFWDNVSILMKGTGLITWLVILLLALLEIKQYYHIDIIPGYDSAVDDVYGAMRGSISETVRDFK